MSTMPRKPTAAEQKKLDFGREMIREGNRAASDWFFKRFMPTEAMQGRNQSNRGQRILDEVRDDARNYDAYQNMTYMKKGGSVGSASKRADGCAQRGKTKGKFV